MKKIHHIWKACTAQSVQIRSFFWCKCGKIRTKKTPHIWTIFTEWWIRESLDIIITYVIHRDSNNNVYRKLILFTTSELTSRYSSMDSWSRQSESIQLLVRNFVYLKSCTIKKQLKLAKSIPKKQFIFFLQKSYFNFRVLITLCGASRVLYVVHTYNRIHQVKLVFLIEDSQAIFNWSVFIMIWAKHTCDVTFTLFEHRHTSQ